MQCAIAGAAAQARQRLADHVKLKEHELFPLIERTIPEPELSALGDLLRDATRPRPSDSAGTTPRSGPSVAKPTPGNDTRA
jgi:hypothetical protein